MEKCGRQAIDGDTAHALGMVDIQGYRHTRMKSLFLSHCNNGCTKAINVTFMHTVPTLFETDIFTADRNKMFA